MEELRLVFRTVSTNGSTYPALQQFFQNNIDKFLLAPTSDRCAVIYRLFENEPKNELLKVAAFQKEDKTMSLLELFYHIEYSFTFSKKKIPIIYGFPPRIYL